MTVVTFTAVWTHFSITLLFIEFTEFINKLVFYIQWLSVEQQNRKDAHELLGMELQYD